LIFRAAIFGKWLGVHYMVGRLDGGKFVAGVERAVARLRWHVKDAGESW
jgi:hypothetical protein